MIAWETTIFLPFQQEGFLCVHLCGIPQSNCRFAEHAIIQRIRRAKWFVFLRQHRPTLLSDPFQEALATLYKDQLQGHPPVPPAQLALATLLQAYADVSDDAVIEATTMDRRWQLVLDCLDCDTPPFSKGTLVKPPPAGAGDGAASPGAHL